MWTSQTQSFAVTAVQFSCNKVTYRSLVSTVIEATVLSIYAGTDTRVSIVGVFPPAHKLP
jgi:hypothetical protein